MRANGPLVVVCGMLSFSQMCFAADASWTAVSTLEKGTSQNCGGGQSDWRVDITGTTLKYVSSATNVSFTVDLKPLQPDGSGRAVGKDDKNREFYVVFEPGGGPRPFHVTNSLNACGRVFTPKK
jgi:hypothetical protein